MLDSLRAFAFDMDGTLIDSMTYWRGENRKFLARHGYPVPPDLEDKLDTMSSHTFARIFSEAHPEAFSYEEICAEYLEIMEKLYQTVIPLKPGARELLSFLRERGVRLCVATATPRETAKRALKRHGILDAFEFVTDDAENGIGKGDPAYFPRLAERMGVRADEMALFEDSRYAMISGREAGLTVFAIEEAVYLRKPEVMRDIKAASHFFVKDFFEARRVFDDGSALKI